MQQINVSELKQHPRNTEFFDDMEGEKWKEFLESVRRRGVIEPVVITPDKMIVSGHQRVRACKELGIDNVICDVHTYNNDDEILQDLLETNVRQRGDVGGSAKKIGCRIKELERLYGSTWGGARAQNGLLKNDVREQDKTSAKNQKYIADMMGISVSTLKRYKQLADMIPELSDLVDEGKVTQTTALALMQQLSPQEQEELISSLDTNRRYAQSDIQKYVEEIKNKESEIHNLKCLVAQTKSEKMKVEKVIQEVDKPETMQKLEKLRKELQDKTEQYSKLYDEYVEDKKLLSKAIGESSNWQLASHCSEITLKMLDFVKDMGQYGYMADTFNEIHNYTRAEYLRCVKAVKKWADTIINEINNNEEYIVVEGD